MKMYGLRVKGSNVMLGIMCLGICNCDGETGPGTEFRLMECDNVWLINSAADVESTRNRGGNHVNSEYYNLPSHNYKAEELEVVSVDFMFSNKG